MLPKEPGLEDLKTPPENRIVKHDPPSEEDLIEEKFSELEQRLENCNWGWVSISAIERRKQYKRAFNIMNNLYKQCEKLDASRAKTLWNKHVQSPYSGR